MYAECCCCGCCCCSVRCFPATVVAAAALCVAFLLLLLPLLAAAAAAAVRHRTPTTRGCSSDIQQYSSTYCRSIFYYDRKYFGTTLGSTVAFERPPLSYIIPCYQVPLLAITGMHGAAGGRMPAAAKPRWYFVKY